MTAHLPPVPPANRTDKGPPAPQAEAEHEATHRKPSPNAAEQGNTANIAQNTSNTGHQQDR